MKSFEFLKSRVTVLKYLLVGAAFLGLLGWNANLQRRLVDDHVGIQSEEAPSAAHIRGKRSVGSSNGLSKDALFSASGGAVFVRWGRRDCPDDNSELVYSGIVGASLYTETGGSGEYTCLTREPQYAKYTDALEGSGKIYGVEYEIGSATFFDSSKAPSGKLHDADVVCAVCRSKSYSSQLMIPGRKECFDGWRKEYWGYLMTAHFAHKAQHNWACVDNTPEGDEKGAKNDNGGLMYHVQGVCGSLPCPNYVQGRELTCVVCTK